MMSPVVDPYAVYRRLRREQPVICVEGLLGRDYLVTRYEDVLAIKLVDVASTRGSHAVTTIRRGLARSMPAQSKAMEGS